MSELKAAVDTAQSQYEKELRKTLGIMVGSMEISESWLGLGG